MTQAERSAQAQNAFSAHPSKDSSSPLLLLKNAFSRLNSRILLVPALLAVLAGCGESRLTVDLVNHVQAGELTAAQTTIDDLYGTDADEALVRHMEKGLVSHLQGDFNASDRELDLAAPLVDDLRGSQVGDAIVSSLYNDTVTTYVGKPFEHTQVDYYRTLNSLLAAGATEGLWVPPTIMVPAREPLLPDPPVDVAKTRDKAIIVARRMTLNQLKETEDASGSKRYDDDPFARVLAACAVLCEAPQRRTESDQQFTAAMLTRALKAYDAQQEQLGKNKSFRYEVNGQPTFVKRLYLRHLLTYDPDLYASESQRLGITDAVPAPGTGSVLVLNQVGRIARPQPLQIGIAAVGFRSDDSTHFNWGSITFFAKGPGSDIARDWILLPIPGDVVQRILAPGGATVIGFEIPVHEPDAPAPGPAMIRAGDRSAAGEVVCDLDAYARSRLKDDQPALLLKTLLRVAAKQAIVAIGARAANQKNENSDGGLLGLAINLAGSALATATESADLRAWNTLPNLVEATLIDLPVGTHPLSITTTSGSHELGPVRIEAGRLTLVSVRTMPPR